MKQLMLWLQDDIDLVTTDVLAILILLGQDQAQCCPDKLHMDRHSRDSFTVSRPAWMTVPRARHYMRFALAVFGWPMYLLPSQHLMQSMWRVYHVSRYMQYISY